MASPWPKDVVDGIYHPPPLLADPTIARYHKHRRQAAPPATWDRSMWVSRSRSRIEEDWRAGHATIAKQTFGPHLSFERLSALPFDSYKSGVRAFEGGGEPFNLFRSSSRPLTIASASRSSLRREHDRPTKLEPMNGARHMISSQSLPALSALPSKAKQPADATHPRPTAFKPNAFQTALPSAVQLYKAPSSAAGAGRAERPAFMGAVHPNSRAHPTIVHPPAYQHVDHALEMFREGHAIGDHTADNLTGLRGGYRFDGEVAAIGAGDHAPVTAAELEIAHDLIREKVKMRWGELKNAFRTVDEDKSGAVTKLEFLRVLMLFNLTQIREKTAMRLAQIMDTNRDDKIDYAEFCRHLQLNDAKDT